MASPLLILTVLSSNELYVLASQVRYVFYVEDQLEKDWDVLLKKHHVTSITCQIKIQ